MAKPYHVGLTKGAVNGKWRGGIALSDKGYRRITHGKNRGKYEHRQMAEELLLDPISYLFAPGQAIPEWAAIHHIDFNKQHNCHGNLQFLQHSIHNAIHAAYKKYILDHYEEYVVLIAAQNNEETEEIPF